VLVKNFEERDRIPCKKCGRTSLTPQMGASLVKFEGSGFYVNDYPQIKVKTYNGAQG